MGTADMTVVDRPRRATSKRRVVSERDGTIGERGDATDRRKQGIMSTRISEHPREEQAEHSICFSTNTTFT